MDISSLSIAELEELAKRIPGEIKKRKIAEKDKALQEVIALAASRGFGLDELLEKSNGSFSASGNKTRKPAKIKYRHPQQNELTWTGRGRKPHWVVEWIASGNKIEALAVA